MLHENLKNKIAESKYTMSDVARLVKCDTGNLSKFLNTGRGLSARFIDKIMELLKIKF